MRKISRRRGNDRRTIYADDDLQAIYADDDLQAICDDPRAIYADDDPRAIYADDPRAICDFVALSFIIFVIKVQRSRSSGLGKYNT
jgi:hypothetical protein